MLEDARIDETWVVEHLSSQSPVHTAARPSRQHPDQLVLYDMNRAAEWVEFRPVRQVVPLYTVFVGEGGLSLMTLEPVSVYGEPRYVITHGACRATTSAELRAQERAAEEKAAAAARLAAAPQSERERCDHGSVVMCLQVGNNLMKGGSAPANEAEAVLYFKKACDLRSTEGCIKAGQLYDKVGMKGRARAAFDAACHEGDTSSCLMSGALR